MRYNYNPNRLVALLAVAIAHILAHLSVVEFDLSDALNHRLLLGMDYGCVVDLQGLTCSYNIKCCY